MKRFTPLVFFFLYMVTSCTSNPDKVNPESWSEDELNTWFDGKEWLGSKGLTPDPSIDKKEFAIRYHQHKDRWDKAFAFLKKEDLAATEPGNHEIDGKDVYVIVSEYNSKDPQEARYESHKKYTDLQYVVSGTEYIGLRDLAGASVVTPYDEERDIAFYEPDGGVNLTAGPGKFFIFFPGNVHRPGMRVGESVPVKKIVIKVRN